MKWNIHFFCLVACSIFLTANRLTAQPAYTKADSITVFTYLEKAEVFFEDSNYDSAFFYVTKAEILSKQKDFKTGQAFSYIKAAEIYIDQDELGKAEANAVMANKIGLQTRDSLATAVGWMLMAQVKMYSNYLEEATELFIKCLQYYLDRHPGKYTPLAFNDLGYTWGKKGELAKQASCIMQAIGIYENYFPEEYGELGVSFNNLSAVYYGLNQLEKAIEYGKKALVYREKDGDIGRLSLGCCNISQYYTQIDKVEADKYLKLCVKYALQSKQESRMIHSYVTASRIYSYNGKSAEAYEYEIKAIELLEKNGKDPAMLGHRYLGAGILAQQLKLDTVLIASYFNKSLKLIQSLSVKSSMRDYYLEISKYYNSIKNYEAAYDNYRKYILYRDSIVNDKTQASIAEITARYETEKKDNEIARLNTAQRIKQLEIEKQKAVIDGNEAAALQKQNEIDLLSKSQELQDIRIRQQGEELEKQSLLVITNAQRLQLTEKENLLQEKQLKNQKNVRNLLIGGLALFLLLGITWFNRYQLKKKLEQQKSLLSMRNNISQDLHDDIGASLSNINILNELARRNVNQPEKSTEYLSRASEDIQRISESLSDIVWNINPRYDDLQNLFVRMKRYGADMLDGKGINGEFEFPVTSSGFTLSMTQRRDLYLIYKEAVNNLAKYSQATNAVISIRTEADKIELLVKDDGIGFDNTVNRNGNGLQNMAQRARSSGAILSIDSLPGKGTTVLLTLAISYPNV